MDVFRPNLAERDSARPRSATLRILHFVAMSAVVMFAFLAVSGAGPVAVWGKSAGLFSPRQKSLAFSEADLDRQTPQKQAEMLLERAVSCSGTAGESEVGAQIEARLGAWRGKLDWDSQLGDLTTVALNSSDPSVRASAIEIQLAAYGLTKSESSVDALVQQANSPDHAKKIWALWALGLLGNRGVETDRVVQALTAHLEDFRKDSATDKNKNRTETGDENTRRWAVEGLALVGTTPTIAPLLEAMHNDPSPVVRERAACSLAESGMLTHQQRMIAIPQLINYSGDPSLDPQTQAWAFQALAKITRQSLPNDYAAWRNWYKTSAASSQ
jgi:HEAT repeat protein